MVPIRYVGDKERKADNVTGSAYVWSAGSVCEVPMHVAVELVKHPTVWQQADDQPLDASAREHARRIGLAISGEWSDAQLDAHIRDRAARAAGLHNFSIPNPEDEDSDDVAVAPGAQRVPPGLAMTPAVATPSGRRVEPR